MLLFAVIVIYCVFHRKYVAMRINFFIRTETHAHDFIFSHSHKYRHVHTPTIRFGSLPLPFSFTRSLSLLSLHFLKIIERWYRRNIVPLLLHHPLSSFIFFTNRILLHFTSFVVSALFPYLFLSLLNFFGNRFKFWFAIKWSINRKVRI